MGGIEGEETSPSNERERSAEEEREGVSSRIEEVVDVAEGGGRSWAREKLVVVGGADMGVFSRGREGTGGMTIPSLPP